MVNQGNSNTGKNWLTFFFCYAIMDKIGGVWFPGTKGLTTCNESDKRNMVRFEIFMQQRFWQLAWRYFYACSGWFIQIWFLVLRWTGTTSTSFFRIISGHGFTRRDNSFQTLLLPLEQGRTSMNLPITDYSIRFFCFLICCRLCQWSTIFNAVVSCWFGEAVCCAIGFAGSIFLTGLPLSVGFCICFPLRWFIMVIGIWCSWIFQRPSHCRNRLPWQPSRPASLLP